jgi:hypothetical protein
MNPLPGNGGIPSNTLLVDGNLDLLLWASVAVIVVILGMMVWMAWHSGERRERLICPVRLRSARVLMQVTASGRPKDVIRCSIFGRRPMTCGKPCMRELGA